MTTTYQLDDGNTYEKYDTIQDAAAAAEDWYEYMIDQDDDISAAARDAIRSADFSDCVDVAALNTAIGKWEEQIAVACGRTSYAGHGNYYVSAAAEMGLQLACRAIDA